MKEENPTRMKNEKPKRQGETLETADGATMKRTGRLGSAVEL